MQTKGKEVGWMKEVFKMEEGKVYAGGMARDTSGSVRMHLSLPLHKKHLGFGTNNIKTYE